MPSQQREKNPTTLSIAASLLLITTTANTAEESTITTTPQGVNLSKSNSDSSQNISIAPTKDGVKSSFSLSDKRNYQIDIGAYYESSKVKNDIVLDASYRMLYEGAKLGTYIGITKGSELEKFVLSQGFALKKGRIKLSVALLRSLTLLDFSEYSQSYKERLTQKSFGAEYSYNFERDSLLQEIKTSIIYYDLENKEIGRIGDIIIDNATLYDWTRVYGGYRGGVKVLGDVSAGFKLLDNLKATVSMGYDRLTYKAMYDQREETSTKLALGTSLTYRINDYHQIEAYAKNQNSQKTGGAKYTHDFGNALSGYLSMDRLVREYAPSDTQYRFGLSYSFGAEDKHTRLSPLFASSSVSSTMSLSEVAPIASVNSDNFAISPKKVIHNEHIAKVDKTALAAGDGITLNSDGTLANIYFDNGGFNVLSIDTVNDSSYLPYLGIVGGKLAVVNIMALNSHMASQGLTTGQTKALNVAVTDAGGASLYTITITKGSVEITASVQRAHNVTPAQKAAFIAGTKTIAQINTENGGGGNHAPTANDFTYGTAVAHSAQTFSWLTLSSATDANGDTMSATVQTNGTKGTAVVSGNNITYTPTANKSGTDTVVVTISDGNGGTKNITITLNSIDTTNGIVRVGNIVTDYNTGLKWQDDAAAATYKADWTNAGSYCSGITVDGVSGWRLPTRAELEGIVNAGNSPAIKSGFANTASNYYWSSDGVDATFASAVGFLNGDSGWGHKSVSRYVRCVK